MFLIAWMVWDSMLPGTIVPSVGESPILEGFEVSFALTQGSQSGLKERGFIPAGYEKEVPRPDHVAVVAVWDGCAGSLDCVSLGRHF